MKIRFSGQLGTQFDVDAVLRRRLRQWAGFGPNLFRHGTLITDDYATYDTVGAQSL